MRSGILTLPVYWLRSVYLLAGVVLSMTNLSQAQVSNELSSLLQLGEPQQTEELPAPAKSPSPAPQDERIYLGLDAEQPLEGIGVRVASVTRDSPAWKAGFKTDDRILGINGYAIANMEDMIEQLGKTKPGQSVNFLVHREPRNIQLVAVLMNAEVADRIQSAPGNPASVPAWLGVTATDLTVSFREQFGIGAFRGAAVTQVVNGSPAYQAGVRPGDAIVEAAGRPIETAVDVQKIIETSKPGDLLQLVYYRGSAQQVAKVVLVGDPQILAAQQTPPTLRTPTLPRTSAAKQEVKPLENAASGDSAKPEAQPSDTSPAVAPAVSPDKPSAREAALEAEVAKLRKELAEAQAKLAETRQQLDNILKSLRN